MLRTFPRLHTLMKNIEKAFFFLRAGRDQVSLLFQSERVEKNNWKSDKLEEKKKVRQLRGKGRKGKINKCFEKQRQST